MATIPERLRDLIDTHKHETADELSKTILEKFIVLDKALPGNGPQPTPEVGQFWRNRQSHRLIRITKIVTYNRPGTGDIHWEIADDSRGPAAGAVWSGYWTTRFTHVSDS